MRPSAFESASCWMRQSAPTGLRDEFEFAQVVPPLYTNVSATMSSSGHGLSAFRDVSSSARSGCNSPGPGGTNLVEPRQSRVRWAARPTRRATSRCRRFRVHAAPAASRRRALRRHLQVVQHASEDVELAHVEVHAIHRERMARREPCRRKALRGFSFAYSASHSSRSSSGKLPAHDDARAVGTAAAREAPHPAAPGRDRVVPPAAAARCSIDVGRRRGSRW